MDGRGPSRPRRRVGRAAPVPRPSPQARLRHRATTARRALALAVAALAGIGLAILDSSQGFDATGITAGGLLIAGATSALIDGSGSWSWATLVVVLVGGWIPLAERQLLPTPLVSLVFAAIGAYAGAWSARLRR